MNEKKRQMIELIVDLLENNPWETPSDEDAAETYWRANGANAARSIGEWDPYCTSERFYFLLGIEWQKEWGNSNVLTHTERQWFFDGAMSEERKTI